MASPAEDVVPPPRVLLIAALLITSGATLYILYLIDGPTVPEFHVDSAIFSPVNVAGSNLTAAWDLTFRVQNPNHKFSIFYENLEVAVLYGRDFTIAIVQLPPFSQPKKNTTIVLARLRLVGAYVGDGVMSEISKNRTGGSLPFGVKVVGRTRFRPRLWRIWVVKPSLHMRCKSVEFMVSGNGTASTPSGPTASTLCEYVYYRRRRRYHY